jgi:aryl-alcohol dehydrogenase-like predicted oxidoreductase
MKHKALGRTGMRVSELCLGTMSFGGSSDFAKIMGAQGEQDAAAQVNRALDAGITFFDSADGYGDGESETLLGKALGTKRKDVVVATKAGFPTGPMPLQRGLSRRHLMQAVEASLRRLGTDWIDVYFAHRRDPDTPVEETMRAFGDLVRSGKVRALGASNWPAWQVMKANAFAAANGLPRFEILQMNYSLAVRDVEREIVPLVRDQGLGLMAWSPLAGGVLTGKYGADGRPPEGARRGSFELGPMDWARVARILGVAKTIAAPPAHVALAWLSAQPHVTSVMIGAKRLDQLEANLGALAVSLAPEELRRLDDASALPPEYPGWFCAQFDGL